MNSNTDRYCLADVIEWTSRVHGQVCSHDACRGEVRNIFWKLFRRRTAICK